MSRERNILQVKEEDKKKKSKLEISYLLDKEFKVMIIKTQNDAKAEIPVLWPPHAKS